ncbi:DUF4345 domain-containing protein [Demequina sp. NBRC 110054]|uniref:DUF4345 domain-containing protein n=1 Tax=Demequina sp. NBRC 110054 TaxID=1570343 RepID=UPI000A072B64|nr:DUF4345 domain-containing protein [Demequina sp. NBRC 110054]
MSSMTTVRIYLGVSALIAGYVGAGLLLAPHWFHEQNGVPLGDDVGLLSETRAPGGFLLLSACVLASMVATRRGEHAGLVLATTVYSGWAIGRAVGSAVDGMPPASLLVVWGCEAVGALVGIGLLVGGATRGRTESLTAGEREAARV